MFEAKAKSTTTANDAGAFKPEEKNIHECDFPCCNYTRHTKKSTPLHKVRYHSHRTHESTAHKTGCQTANINNRENFTAEGDSESVVSSETVSTVHSHTADSVEPDSDVNYVTRRTESIVNNVQLRRRVYQRKLFISVIFLVVSMLATKSN